MKRFSLLAALSLIVPVGLASQPAGAQDPVTIAPSVYKVLLENDHVRLLEIRLKPGKKSAMHSHPNYVAYALKSGKVRFTAPDGKTTDAELSEGRAMWREAESHAAENIGSSELRVLNFEVKEGAAPPPPAPATAPDPLEVSPEHYDVLLENERVRVMVVSDKPGEKWGAHRHPARVVYALTPYKLRFTYPDGRTETAEGKAGTAVWADAVVHVGENIGTGPSRVLLVELKSPPSAGSMGLMNIPAEQIKWETMMPEVGDGSPEIAILHVDPKTQATHLMIRCRRAFHVPPHWHSANETHTVLSGRFLLECLGERALLGPGSFNYIPAREHHEAWVEPEPGRPFAVLITVDGPWDMNWVSGPPTAADMDVPLPAAR